ncbi:MAG: hypothetical protein IJ580_07530 [Prevotella sp.]|nr:hypothetical protein [Prevotella sp.]MBR1556778.1 hypothetical protein [Prevotella sp.]
MKKTILSLIAVMAFAMNTLAASFETDREWYLAGETMKVSITADDAEVAYAELCDTHGIKAGVAVRIDGGRGTGKVELPSELHSGYYVLSVYTRHNSNVANKLVAVVNPLHKNADDNIKWVEIASPDSSSYLQTGDFSAADLVSKKVVDVRETEGHIIKARVKNVVDGQTFKGSQIFPTLSIIGMQVNYFEGKMVNDSLAVFYTYGIYGKQPLVLSARTSTGVSLPIEVISPFATLIPKKLPRLVFHYKRSEVEARSIEMQKRHPMAATSIVPLEYDDNVHGTKPDLTYNLDEYRQFLTIREVLIEYVSCVSKRKTNGVSRLVVRFDVDPSHSFLPSLVLIDGMPVFDTERLLSYDARRIHYINIYGGHYTFGNNIYNGLLSFVTRSGRLTNYPTEHNMQYLEYDFPE